MPARAVPLVTGEYYHLYNRGVNRAPIFLDARSYSRAIELLRYYQYTDVPFKYSYFLTLSREERNRVWEKLADSSERLIDLIAYCLMPNHYHFLLRQRVDGGAERFVSNWQKSLAKYLNLRHDRVGPVFNGRFRAVRVEDDRQLLHLSRYIHLNPYTAFIVKTQGELLTYTRSSIPEYVHKPNICTTPIVLAHFEDSKAYRKFVLDRADYQRNLGTIRHLVLE